MTEKSSTGNGYAIIIQMNTLKRRQTRKKRRKRALLNKQTNKGNNK